MIVKLNGRLGNQIFQYAFAFSLQKKLGRHCIIDDFNYPNYFKFYFKDPFFISNKILKYLYLKFYKPKLVIIQTGTECAELIMLRIEKNCNYVGFFQSEKYFIEFRKEILSTFLIKNKYTRQFAEIIKNISTKKKILAIHFRLTDYIEWGNSELGEIDLSLPDTYYYNAIQEVENINEYEIYIVSDCIDEAKNRIPMIRNKNFFSDSEIIDFQFLMNADLLIVSNSSFAWWAAYLNKKHIQIIAPKNWLGFKVDTEFPKEIIPKNFSIVDVY